jgi:putative protein-disulfide isomerase
MRLVYFADPLCSWCYGFGPELAALLERRPAQVRLVMGGLRPYNRETMSPAFKGMLRGHWAHVAEASGLAFSPKILERDDFVYDTEPPCRAVVTAREIDSTRALAVFKAIQAGFYAEGRDMTRAGALADAAADCGYAFDDFVAKLGSETMREATRGDFATSQSLGVAGFPTLAVEQAGELFLVTSGYARADVLDERIAEIERRAAGAKP